jgi:hypothetical protein
MNECVSDATRRGSSWHTDCRAWNKTQRTVLPVACRAAFAVSARRRWCLG